MRYQAIAGAVAASAALGASASIPPAYLDHLPAEQMSEGGVVYLTGGKTLEEGNSVRRAAEEYPLELVFREKDGARAHELYDNPVVIRDADSGRLVFAGRTDGPYFLARLPKGRYTVTTHWDSWTFTKPVTIGDERQRVVFEWKKLPRTRVVSAAENG